MFRPFVGHLLQGSKHALTSPVMAGDATHSRIHCDIWETTLSLSSSKSCHLGTLVMQFPSLRSKREVVFDLPFVLHGLCGGCHTRLVLSLSLPPCGFGPWLRQWVPAFLTAVPSAASTLAPWAPSSASSERSWCFQAHCFCFSPGHCQIVSEIGRVCSLSVYADYRGLDLKCAPGLMWSWALGSDLISGLVGPRLESWETGPSWGT